MSTQEIPSHQGIHHLKLPVTDLERSTRWYHDVLGARRLTELDHRRPDGTLFAVILDIPGINGKVELRLDPATAAALKGYDFLTLTIEDRPALDAWIARLDALGIPHSPAIVAMVGWLLVATDPDGQRLRFYTRQPHGLEPSTVEFKSPWLGTGPLAPEQDTAVCAVATMKALPGHADEVRELMRSVAQDTRQEDGCLAYLVHQAEDAPGTVVVYERWASPAALAAHHRTAHMDAFKKATGSLVEWPPRQEMLTPCD
ncbi:antibiotic biosynthesis monooxygenase [Amycolatopsis saalfeldensis]|uniref:Quinol monooxygenase YgiN n=1 Tax=Amycolatopsis saalfeldensis TaxID=394193 RepID=A0A1H8YP17_9PSEU|nr:antibiotic biosynthesis monooxygenase [Amycolatopsis saalfeldensis]SEP53896.1 Quinol monooxygenase YgiN [Amycolatopsis saalfeldensis]